MKNIIILFFILMLINCSPDKPAPAPKIIDGPEYFPMADGDKWFYSTQNVPLIIRQVSGDTTVAGVSCKRVFENMHTIEAWTVDSTGFRLHLLAEKLWLDPPLEIPFKLVQGESFSYQSKAFFYKNDSLVYYELGGKLQFSGYVTKEVKAGKFSNVLKFHYSPDGGDPYDEYYAKGVGLLDNGEYLLDSAYIGGKWYK